MESDSHIYGLLGRIHVLMRRVLNRITDVEYMRISADYTREILRIAEATDNPELHELCAKLRAAMELDGPPAKREEKGMAFGFGTKKKPDEEEGDDRYIRSLR
ncbi:MAG TPA: hypothetical protein VL550_04170 [Rhodocyclaceae bacterium]|jgi:hypothetical protein|nr:hypothetical protein [Rhodocyclaceae bacterium]